MNKYYSSIIVWTKSHIFLIIACALTFLLGLKASNTDPTNSLKDTQEHAIQKAKILAHHIVNGNVKQLVHHADDSTIEKLQKLPIPSFEDISQTTVYETKHIPIGHWLLAPVRSTFFAPPESRMQIMRLERKGSFFVMTFSALRESNTASYIDADGYPLIVSVAIRYIESQPTSVASEWLGRFTNMEWLPNHVREKVSGDWYLIDYRYSFNLREYYNWVRANEERLFRQSEQRNQQFLSEVKSAEWLNNLKVRSSDELFSNYKWSYVTSEDQFTNIVKELTINRSYPGKQETPGANFAAPSIK